MLYRLREEKNVNKGFVRRPLFKGRAADPEHLRDCRRRSVHSKRLMTNFNWTINAEGRKPERQRAGLPSKISFH